MARPIRVLIGKPGLDGHDRGAKVIARALRDAGMEVIYTGLHQTPQMIFKTALDEDVDVIGLSILSGAHNRLVLDLVDLFSKAGEKMPLLIIGGIIPADDHENLKKHGVAGIFTPGTSFHEMVDFIRASINL